MNYYIYNFALNKKNVIHVETIFTQKLLLNLTNDYKEMASNSLS